MGGVKKRLVFIICIAQFGLVLIAFLIQLFGGFRQDEFITIISVLAPLFAIYMAPTIKYIKDNFDPKDKAEVILLGKWFYYVVIGLHFLCYLLLMILLALNFIDIKDIRLLFPLVESLFGYFTSNILSSIFNH